MSRDSIVKKTGRAKQHQKYFAADGEQLPGGSTIAKICDFRGPDGLMAWAVKLEREGIDYRKYREEAAAFGNTFHRVVECHSQGVDFDSENYVGAYVEPAQAMAFSFFEKLDKLGLAVIGNEIQGVSENVRVGGTIDLLLARKGETEPCGLGDLKSSNSVGSSEIIQVAGCYAPIYTEKYGKPPEVIYLFRVDRNPPHPCYAHKPRNDQIQAAQRVTFHALGAWREKPVLTKPMIVE